jgi:membrane protease YdiL (CAAX protease family)
MNSFFFRILLFPAYLLAHLLLSRIFPGRGDLLAAGSFIILIIVLEKTVYKEDTALETPEFPSLILALAAGFSFSLSLLFLMEAAVPHSRVLASLESVSDLCLSENASPLWVLTCFILLPLAEELVFRAGLQNAMEQRYGLPVSIVASVLAFCLFGLIRDGTAGLFFCFFTGILSSLFFVLYGNAWVSVCAHIGCSIALAFLYLRYFLSPAALLAAAGISFLSAGVLIFHALRSQREEEMEEQEENEKEEAEEE